MNAFIVYVTIILFLSLTSLYGEFSKRYYNNIGINQYTAKLTLSSTQDLYIPTMVTFSTELYSPQICYDYTLNLGSYLNIDSVDRNFTVDNYLNQPLELKILIKSKEADFDLLESKLRASFTPDNVFQFKHGLAKTSYPNSTTYYDAIETDLPGEIAIGSNTSSEGGTISADEIIYSKLYYDFNKDSFNGKLDIFLDAKISFDGVNKVPYSLSTIAPKGSTSYIGRCATNSIYDPTYGVFNIENGSSDSTQTDAKKYSLKTQIVGVPYSISVASYQKDLNGDYREELNRNTTVELELIDGGTFDNNSSAGFDSVCQDPDTYSAGAFVHFNNSARVKVNIPQDYTTYPSQLALRNAIFRVWALVKTVNNNKVLVDHNCQNQSDYICFKNVYYANYWNSEYTKNNYLCFNKCNYTTDNSCYKCLRENYATPICSRDNFSIRPDSYSIDIFDNKENNASIVGKVDIGKNIDTTPYHISAGYVYPLEINATVFGSREHVDGYIFSNNRYKTDSATARFASSSSCLDKSDKNLNISLSNGTTNVYENNTTSQPKNGIFLNNSGSYKIDIIDNSWTLVDQVGYKNKPFPDISDCEANSTISNSTDLNARRGCTIKNGVESSYPSLNLTSHPYIFDLSSIDVKSNPNINANYLYINDLTNTPPSNLIGGGAMSIKINGSIVAKGEDNSSLSNYTDGCMANDLNIKIKYYNDQNETNKNIALMYSTYGGTVISQKDKTLIDYNMSSSRINMVPTASYFNYLNFEREYDKPLNPFKFTIDEFNVTSPSETITVNMVKNYIPKGHKELNTTKILYYAKATSKSDFYDDIYDDSVDTPIAINIFCDKSLSYCREYGIDTTNDYTNEYNWWLSKEHNASFGDGIVKLEINSLNGASSKIEVKPATADKFIEAVDNSIKVAKIANADINYPYMVFIDPTSTMKSNYSYLLYNRYKNEAPKHLYKVRFVDTSASWSGTGKTGFTTDFNSTGRKNNKVDW